MSNVKFAIIIPDGCADEPQSALAGQTPLQAASIPAMDEIARLGVVGRANHVPVGFTPGSEVANLSLLGYDPRQFFTGRAPIEAAGRGIELGQDDWAIRCNLVCIERKTMRDFTAGHISSDEAKSLLCELQQLVSDSRWEFIPGVSYRNLLIFRGAGVDAPFTADTTTTAPHDLSGHSIIDAFPRGPGSDLLADLMCASEEILASADVNQERRRMGQLPATHIWLWGLGQAPRLPSFQHRFGLRGTMITAVDLLRGLARLIGWECIAVPGATGYLDTDYAAKGRFAVDALDQFDVVCVHIEAPDEASHEGNVAAKVEALEQIDRHIVAPIHERLRRHGTYRILVTPDHPTYLSTRMHTRGFVPWCSCGTGIVADGATTYWEGTASGSNLVDADGSKQMERFLQCH